MATDEQIEAATLKILVTFLIVQSETETDEEWARAQVKAETMDYRRARKYAQAALSVI
jgi:hypothetical protein